MKVRSTVFSHILVGLGVSLLISCSGGGYGGGGSDQPASLTISIAPATITLGQSATITWSSNAPCMASGAWDGTKPASGSETVTPATTGTFTYTLTCRGDGYGSSGSESATLTVNPVMAAGLWSGESCCIESESFQVTGVTSESGDYRFVLLGTHYVGKSGTVPVAFATCDSCLAGPLITDPRAFRLLAVTPRMSARASIQASNLTMQPQSVVFSVPFDQAIERRKGVDNLQGTYTTNLGLGYTLTMTVDAASLVIGSDTNGCSLLGKVSNSHSGSANYDVALDVTTCGSSNGRYDGKAALTFDSGGQPAGLFLSASNDKAAIGWHLSR